MRIRLSLINSSRIIILLLFLAGAFSAAAPASIAVAAKPSFISSAVTGQASDINGNTLPNVDANTDTIKTVMQIVFGFIGAFALFSITTSGLKYITSAGDSAKVSEAKKGIVFALVGLMLAVSAEAIVTFVVKGPS